MFEPLNNKRWQPCVNYQRQMGRAGHQFNLGLWAKLLKYTSKFIGVERFVRGGPRNLDSGLSEISIVFQAAVLKPVVPKYTTSGVRRPSEL